MKNTPEAYICGEQGFQEGWNSMRRELSMLYSRFYGCLLAGIVLIYQMQRYSGVLILLVYSFWFPQIIHNIHHDHRKPQALVARAAQALLTYLSNFGAPTAHVGPYTDCTRGSLRLTRGYPRYPASAACPERRPRYM